MAEDYDTKIRIGMEADLAGGVQTEKQYDKLKQKAREFGKEAGSSSNSASAALGRVTSAVGKVKSALASLTIGSVFIAGLQKIAESFKSAKKNASEFAEIDRKLKEKSSLAEMANDARRLADAVADAVKSQNRQLTLIDDQVSARRRLQKANLEAAKESELSGLDPNAEDYGEQVKLVEAKYARISAQNASSDAKENVMLQRQKIASDIEIKNRELSAESANESLIRRKIADARREKGAADIASESINEEDKSGFFDALGKTLAQLATGQWGRAAGATTEEGDRIRKENKAKSSDISLRIIELEEELRKSQGRQRDLRAERRNLNDRLRSTDTLLEAADIEGDTINRTARRGQETAGLDLMKKRAKIEADEQTYERAVREKDSVDRQIEQAKAQLAMVQEQKAQNGLAMARAGDAYDMAVANGRPAREQRAAFDERQRAIREAQNAGHAFDRVEAELVATIKNLTERQNSLARTLSTFKKQSKADNSEYAGD